MVNLSFSFRTPSTSSREYLLVGVNERGQEKTEDYQPWKRELHTRVPEGWYLVFCLILRLFHNDFLGINSNYTSIGYANNYMTASPGEISRQTTNWLEGRLGESLERDEDGKLRNQK